MTQTVEREIETLRSLFWSERDPYGRAFVPLADAYRRAGEFRRAFELLRDGLDRHPRFASGHAVAARLYLDRGLAAEAEIAARQALDLDRENVVALGALAGALDARDAHEEANEARARLAELEGDPEVEEDAAPEESAEGEEDIDAVGTEAEAAAQEADDPTGRPALGEAVATGTVGALAGGVAALALPAGTPELEPPAVPSASEAEVEPVAGDGGVAELDLPVADVDALSPDLPVVDVADLAPDLPVVDVADLAPDLPVVDVARLAPGAEPGPAAPAEHARAGGAASALALADPVGAPTGDGDEADEPLVTRTLAELYATQGLADRAVDAYRRLLGEVGDDVVERERIIRRIEQLRAGRPRPEPKPADPVLESAWESEAHRGEEDVETPFAWTDEEPDDGPTGPDGAPGEPT